MTTAGFKLQILAPGKADVFLAASECDIPWTIVEQLDRAGIRVVAEADAAPVEERVRTLIGGCAGLVAALSDRARLHCISIEADRAGIPSLDVSAEGADVDGFLAAVLKNCDRLRPYAFMIGRLERDFSHARDAIRAAVESDAGISCLWADDGHHRTNIESVRERTRLLIKHATFVVADLTLGVESPERENPSRAHEIGMAIAYERPLMLCSQEPRRYPYFSIGDMQMTFWSTEDELERDVRSWIRFNGQSVARRVLNHQLATPTVAKPEFIYNRKLRYVGPKTKASFDMRRLFALISARFS